MTAQGVAAAGAQPTLGFIGLGLMGRPLAGHLRAAGYPLRLWARREETVQPWRAQPQVTVMDSPQQLAATVQVLFTMLGDAPDVEQVLFGPQGVVAGAQRGLCVIDLTTLSPTAAAGFAQRLAAHGIGFLDAPVSGGERGAVAAALTIFVGGEAALFARMEPLLRCLGRTVTHLGAAGAGQAAKACNQILTGVGVAALAEAFHFAQQHGADLAAVRQALLGGMAASHILEQHGQRLIEGQFKPGFKAWMHQKDLRIVLEEAHRHRLQLPATAAAAQMFTALVAAGLGEEDSIAVIKSLAPRQSRQSPHSG